MLFLKVLQLNKTICSWKQNLILISKVNIQRDKRETRGGIFVGERGGAFSFCNCHQIIHIFNFADFKIGFIILQLQFHITALSL